MRLASTVFYNIKLQYKHGFYFAYLFVCIVYVIALRLLGSAAREIVTPVLIFTDPAMLGIFFIGGIVLLERGENSLECLFVTPLRPAEYYFAKVISLTFLAFITSIVLAAAGTGGLGFNWALLLTGVGLTSSLFILAGLAVACSAESVVSYAISVVPIMLITAAPFLDFFGAVESYFFYILPTQSSLTLIGSALAADPAPLWELFMSVIILILWNIGIWKFTDLRFKKYVIEGIGKMK